MNYVDTEKSYGWISIILHWVSAASIITLWLTGMPVSIFDIVQFPTPFVVNLEAREFVYSIHAASAKFLLIVIVLHVSGSVKHLVWNMDDTFLRILLPKDSGKENDHQ